jgi:hypothetical protein
MSRSWLRALATVFGLLLGVLPNGATAAPARATFTYDDPALARVDVHHVTGADAAYTQLTAAREVSASSSVGPLGPSTTPSRSRVATEAADEAAASTAARPPGPYVRPSGATTAAQRASVQGLPCVECGAVTPVQVADHIYPLVREWYETGGINAEFMRFLEAVQPQCPACSASQGGQLSWWSRSMKELFGFG